MHALVAIPTRTPLSASESVVPVSVSASAQQFREIVFSDQYKRSEISPRFLPPVSRWQIAPGKIEMPEFAAGIQNDAMLTSESHDRACLRAGDPPPLVLALDVRGESMSSRSRSSQVYAERIGGIGPDDDNGGGGWAVYGAYREGSDSYVDALRGYVDTPSGPPSMHAHPGNGQCAPCGRWF
jgi:hypothetical protein